MFEKHRYGSALCTHLMKVLLLASCIVTWRFLLYNQNQEIYIDAPVFSIVEQSNESTVNLPCLQNLPPSDFSRLINLENFSFLLNNFPCNGSYSNPLLLILIHSAPQNTDKRNIIRKTWGSKDSKIEILFFLGNIDNDEVKKSIESENSFYKDIVQGNFIDCYRNLTYKHVMALKWATYFCSTAKYVLKSDDDIFVNTPGLLKFLSQDISPWGARKLLLCSPSFKKPVKRSYRSKWRVSPIEYSENIYPTYCPGWAIIYSPDVVFQLYKEAQTSKYFWIDDVHITGTLAARINLTQISFGSFVLKKKNIEKVLISHNTANSFLFGPPDLPTNTVENLWNVVNLKKTLLPNV